MSPLPRSEGPSAALEVALRTLKRDGAATVTVEPFSDLSRSDARALRAAWPGLERDTRLTAVTLMASLGAEELRLNFERPLLVALSDTDPEIRTRAADALWESESSTLLDDLLRRLPDEQNPGVRVTLINALGRFARLAGEGQISDTRRAALEHALLAAVADDAHASVRASALAAAAYLRPPNLEAEVEHAFDEGDEAARLAAVQAMGRFGGRAWASRVIDALRSGDSDLRVEAALAAPYVEDNRVVAYLFDAAEDEEDEELQLAAISALGEVGGEQVRRFLEELRDSSEGAIPEAAEEALANANLLEGIDAGPPA